MINQEQQQILSRGAVAWNEWRSKHKEVNIDLSSIDLRKVDLKGVNLEGADLRTADFRDSILTQANLKGANLSHAKFRGAKLEGANLVGTDAFMPTFCGADGRDAKFCKSQFKWADFTDAYLIGADFSEAHLEGARFGRANLTLTKFDRALISGTIFYNSTLEDASLRRAIGEDCSFEGASLFRANLDHAILKGAKFVRANIRRTSLRHAKFKEADFSYVSLRDPEWLTIAIEDARREYGYYEDEDYDEVNEVWVDFEAADLSDSIMEGAQLERANFAKAILRSAQLVGANLTGARLIGADLCRCNLERSMLVETDLDGVKLSGSRVYGISVWGIRGVIKEQLDLCITSSEEWEPDVYVDDLEVAQFIYLLLDRKKIRDVINTVTRKGVLILGRFGDGGLNLLQAIAAWLRRPESGGYLPLLFDFPRPESKTYTETVRTLAGLARFVIVDLSGPSVPQEITATVDLYEIPFVPILDRKRENWSMFRDFLIKERVLEPIPFTDQDDLLEHLAEEVIAPAERLIEKRQQRLDKIFGRA